MQDNAGDLEREAMSENCEWQEDIDGVWETGCGNLFLITEGSPAENDMKFCPYCGKHLLETEFASE